VARLRAREPDLGGDLAGDGPGPLLRELERVFGIVFDGRRLQMVSRWSLRWLRCGCVQLGCVMAAVMAAVMG